MSARNDLVETSVNMISGMIINYFLTILIFGVSFGYATWSTAVFFVVSFLRSYLIRRWFKGKEKSNESSYK